MQTHLDNWSSLPKDVERLQRRLAELPLVPLDTRTRKVRDKVSRELLEKARELACVDRIDLTVGTH